MMVCTEFVETQRLYDQMHRVQRIRKLQQDIAIIENVLYNPSGMKWSDMPRSQNPNDDKKTKLMDDKAYKEKKLDIEKRMEQVEKPVLEKIIEDISLLPENPKGPMNLVLQDVLRYRYLNGYEWEEIMKLMFPDNDAFIDMAESNLRKLHIWNGKALMKFIKCQQR